MDFVINGKGQGVILVEAMSKRDFRKKIIKDVAMMPEFSTLISTGDVEALSEPEKDRLRLALKKAGIPPEYTSSDDSLMGVSIAIAARTVTLS